MVIGVIYHMGYASYLSFFRVNNNTKYTSLSGGTHFTIKYLIHNKFANKRININKTLIT